MKIEVHDLHFSYGAKAVLHGVSFTVEAKHFVGIIGPNGSGKSTLLKCIYRTLKPSAGQILLDGKPLEQMSLRETARKMAVVAQKQAMAFDFTVEDYVLMGTTPHRGIFERHQREDYARMRKALEQTQLSSMASRLLASLSGGEQQRAVLARALAQDCETLLLDEPTNHLDIRHQLALLHIVEAQKGTCVAAFHDLNMAAMFCDEILALHQGRIVAYGSPETVLTEAFIAELYGVRAEVVKDRDGQLKIHYAHPQS